MADISLRRYTNLVATINLLRRRAITLLNPGTWDDRNDSHFLEQYKDRLAAKTVLALCFAEAYETYHHWKVFAPGSDGVCIEFDKSRLLSNLPVDSRLKRGEVRYRRIDEIRRTSPHVEELPFIKRFPYGDEKEFRLVYVNQDEKLPFKDFEISLESIRRINLSPWMSPAMADAIKETIRVIDGCQGLRLNRSTLVENKEWQRLAERVRLD
ncbi:hypothetical protein NKH81_14350 [Mesorhizobium sp. M0959]|uniref:hypothetical protein n=1 Tax=Mesorhizobium sp. M0959 TaxID=2957034 RepID=UPI0033350831